MKTDLITSITLAIVGTVISFLACNLLFGEIEPVSFNSVDDASVDASLSEPDVEIFNYKALNPTVEVYVGNCQNFNSSGECIDESSDSQEQNANEN